jgi:hypothetical protein
VLVLRPIYCTVKIQTKNRLDRFCQQHVCWPTTLLLSASR